MQYMRGTRWGTGLSQKNYTFCLIQLIYSVSFYIETLITVYSIYYIQY